MDEIYETQKADKIRNITTCYHYWLYIPYYPDNKPMGGVGLDGVGLDGVEWGGVGRGGLALVVTRVTLSIWRIISRPFR